MMNFACDSPIRFHRVVLSTCINLQASFVQFLQMFGIRFVDLTSKLSRITSRFFVTFVVVTAVFFVILVVTAVFCDPCGYNCFVTFVVVTAVFCDPCCGYSRAL